MADEERAQGQNQEYEEPSLVDLEDVAGGGEDMMGVCDTGGSGSCTSCDTGGSAVLEDA